jgi:hypothetical protein
MRSVISEMKPDSSASGMKTPGGMNEPSALRQRMSASPPVMRPVTKLTLG